MENRPATDAFTRPGRDRGPRPLRLAFQKTTSSESSVRLFMTKLQGTGLGLSIVRKVVDAHDGIIEATSAPGRGTTFRVTLPVVPIAAYLRESTHGTHTRR